MGRRKKKKNKTQENKKGEILNAHSRCFRGMQVPALFTLNVVSDWHNEEQGRINGCRIHLQQFLTTVNAGL